VGVLVGLGALLFSPAALGQVAFSPGSIVGTAQTDDIRTIYHPPTEEGGGSSWEFTSQRGPASASGGCSVDPGTNRRTVYCPAGTRWEVRLGSGDDRFVGSNVFSYEDEDNPYPAGLSQITWAVSGETGKDWLYGARGDDVLDGGPDQDCALVGEEGDDVVRGGDGNDGLCPDPGAGGLTNTFPGIEGGPGSDVLDGGEGRDRVDAGDSWWDEDADQQVSPDPAHRDQVACGPARDILEVADWNDVVAADCEHQSCQIYRELTSGGDRFAGTVRGDWILGLGGADRLLGGRGDDCLDGGRGNDVLVGGPGDDRLGPGPSDGATPGGNDTLDGGAGNDHIQVGKGNHTLRGGAGRDLLETRFHRRFGGRGSSRLVAGAGRDKLRAFNGRRDELDCGGGRDVASWDDVDRVKNCERRLHQFE
jgi:Ca2+-binding RTX toxin-like protein